jgi:Domain of unknown function (DUF3315).
MTFARTLTLTLALAVAAPLGAAAAPDHCPPGHAKKGWCVPGEGRVLPREAMGPAWRDWRRHDLPAPGRGESYRLVSGELLLVLDATREVLEAVGAVERVLR